MKYINKYSWKSFLSTQAKNINDFNGLFCWEIRSKKQLSSDHPLINDDIIILKELAPFNFFYFSQDDITLLKNSGFTVSARKDPDITIPIKEINLAGRKYHGIRGAINKAKGYNLTCQDNFNDYNDVLRMLEKWDDGLGDKYFQVRTGKNRYFFKNNLHQDCINLFCYDGYDLVSFAVLSPPDKDKCCSYIIGKALSDIKPGLAEFTDIEIYQRAAKLGGEFVNLGGGGKTLKKYKMKFPGAFEINTFDGTANYE